MLDSSALHDKIWPDSMKVRRFGTAIHNYGRLRWAFLAAMIFIALVPVTLVAGLSYTRYRNLLLKSEYEQLSWQLDGSVSSIEHMVNSLRAVVEFVAREDRYLELVSGDSLDEMLKRQRDHFGFLADLGVLDHTGIKRAYYGPYDLVGRDYSNESWFGRVLATGVDISTVYLGYRQAPHFAIAVSKIDPASHRPWVLRATIDALTLQEFVNTIKTEAADDLFIVDQQGILQTSSTLYGATFASYPGNVSPGVYHRQRGAGQRNFEAVGQIPGTPWAVVLVKKQFLHQADWLAFRKKLFLIVVGCVVLGGFISQMLVNRLVELIRRADELQMTVFKEAEQTEKLVSIGRLAAGVGHEINNPLAIINEKSGLIADLLTVSPDFKHKQQIEKNLRGIAISVERCSIITHRLLNFARHGNVQLGTVHINELIEEVLGFLESAMRYSRISLTRCFGEELPPLKSDRIQLQQIFLNIINNAIDAIDRDGKITITTGLIVGDVQVTIEDDGPGMDEEVLFRIFEPFYTTKEQGRGTGLGLSITYGLVKRLGGDISVRSHPGEGTAFTVTLPVEKHEP